MVRSTGLRRASGEEEEPPERSQIRADGGEDDGVNRRDVVRGIGFAGAAAVGIQQGAQRVQGKLNDLGGDRLAGSIVPGTSYLSTIGSDGGVNVTTSAGRKWKVSFGTQAYPDGGGGMNQLTAKRQLDNCVTATGSTDSVVTSGYGITTAYDPYAILSAKSGSFTDVALSFPAGGALATADTLTTGEQIATGDKGTFSTPKFIGAGHAETPGTLCLKIYQDANRYNRYWSVSKSGGASKVANLTAPNPPMSNVYSTAYLTVGAKNGSVDSLEVNTRKGLNASNVGVQLNTTQYTVTPNNPWKTTLYNTGAGGDLSHAFRARGHFYGSAGYSTTANTQTTKTSANKRAQTYTYFSPSRQITGYKVKASNISYSGSAAAFGPQLANAVKTTFTPNDSTVVNYNTGVASLSTNTQHSLYASVYGNLGQGGTVVNAYALYETGGTTTIGATYPALNTSATPVAAGGVNGTFTAFAASLIANDGTFDATSQGKNVYLDVQTNNGYSAETTTPTLGAGGTINTGATNVSIKDPTVGGAGHLKSLTANAFSSLYNTNTNVTSGTSSQTTYTIKTPTKAISAVKAVASDTYVGVSATVTGPGGSLSTNATVPSANFGTDTGVSYGSPVIPTSKTGKLFLKVAGGSGLAGQGYAGVRGAALEFYATFYGQGTQTLYFSGSALSG